VVGALVDPYQRLTTTSRLLSASLTPPPASPRDDTRARLEEERQLHNPTPLGENTKPYERAVCELALEMHEYGGTLPDVMVEYPASYFSRRPKPPAWATEANNYPYEWVTKEHYDPHATYNELREEDEPGSYFVDLNEDEDLLGWTGEWPTDRENKDKPLLG